MRLEKVSIKWIKINLINLSALYNLIDIWRINLDINCRRLFGINEFFNAEQTLISNELL